MKRKTFTPQVIAKLLQEFADGKSVAEISREHGVSQAAFYKWRQRSNGMGATELKRLKDLYNHRLKYPAQSQKKPASARSAALAGSAGNEPHLVN